MNIIEFLKQYDVQEGDLLECENGEVWMYLHSELPLQGPLPKMYPASISQMEYGLLPKRFLRPRWDYLITAHNEETELPTARILKLEILQLKQQALPTITVNVPKGFKVEVRENE